MFGVFFGTHLWDVCIFQKIYTMEVVCCAGVMNYLPTETSCTIQGNPSNFTMHFRIKLDTPKMDPFFYLDLLVQHRKISQNGGEKWWFTMVEVQKQSTTWPAFPPSCLFSASPRAPPTLGGPKLIFNGSTFTLCTFRGFFTMMVACHNWYFGLTDSLGRFLVASSTGFIWEVGWTLWEVGWNLDIWLTSTFIVDSDHLVDINRF